MGKRSNFKRNPRDFYQTPLDGFLPIVRYLPADGKYAELCAGAFKLCYHMIDYGLYIALAIDVKPEDSRITKKNALKITAKDLTGVTHIVTNPPWEKRKHKGELFNRLMRRWLKVFAGEIWVLLDADYLHTKQAAEFSRYCVRVVSVGRISWMDNGKAGMDNCAWYCFKRGHTGGTEFIWRDGARGYQTKI